METIGFWKLASNLFLPVFPPCDVLALRARLDFAHPTGLNASPMATRGAIRLTNLRLNIEGGIERIPSHDRAFWPYLLHHHRVITRSRNRNH
jgi:hypothetical protein